MLSETMRRHYEDKAMSSQRPAQPAPRTTTSAPRPSEGEAREAAQEPRKSDAELAEEREQLRREAEDAAAATAAEQDGEQPPLKDTEAKPAP